VLQTNVLQRLKDQRITREQFKEGVDIQFDIAVPMTPEMRAQIEAERDAEIAAATTEDVPRYGVGLGDAVGDGNVGEAGISGFYVTSTDPAGSGSANTSVFNSGVGQDGTVGKTYLDDVTGLMFTILPRPGNLGYPDTGSFRIGVSKTVTTDSNIPILSIPGVELLVTDTYNVGIGDTALVETFERGGQEPSVGDLYYVSYIYTKQDRIFQLRCGQNYPLLNGPLVPCPSRIQSPWLHI